MRPQVELPLGTGNTEVANGIEDVIERWAGKEERVVSPGMLSPGQSTTGQPCLFSHRTTDLHNEAMNRLAKPRCL